MSTALLTLLGAIVAGSVSLTTGWLVYKAQRQDRRLSSQANDFSHMTRELNRLAGRNDELSEANLELSRKVEEFRSWAWTVIRLLREHGVELTLPPQPNGKDHG